MLVFVDSCPRELTKGGGGVSVNVINWVSVMFYVAVRFSVIFHDSVS